MNPPGFCNTRRLRPERISAGDAAIAEAADLIRKSYPVALPTETVYGLAADATSETAVARVFEAKERPFFDPLIVHLPSLEWLTEITSPDPTLNKLVAKLTQIFWPGPLTILLPRSDAIPDLVTSGSHLVAVRLPAHPVFRAVALAAGRPLAAPSANRFGRVSPTDADAVIEELNSRIPLVLDWGATQHGIESTIIELLTDGSGIKIRRPGPVTVEELSCFAPVLSDFSNSENQAVTPGQLVSHYAPATQVKLFHRIEELPQPPEGQRLGFILWDPPPPGFSAKRVERWSSTGNLIEAASRLFRLLRSFDHQGFDTIFVQTVPEKGVGAAINDRLRRAAAKTTHAVES